jgi:hypothetical protein
MADMKEGPGMFFFASTGKVLEGEWVDGVAKVRLVYPGRYVPSGPSKACLPLS